METNIQRINVKLLASAPENIDLDALLVIFGRWREQENHFCDWVDLADYAHMPKGPGILMVGKQGSFSLNLNDPAPGLLYSGHRDFEGSLAARIVEAFRRCLRLTIDILAEPEFPKDVRVRPGHWLLSLNDRLELPNDDSTAEAVRPDVEEAMNQLFGAGAYRLHRDAGPQRRLSFEIEAQGEPALADLLERAATAAYR